MRPKGEEDRDAAKAGGRFAGRLYLDELVLGGAHADCLGVVDLVATAIFRPVGGELVLAVGVQPMARFLMAPPPPIMCPLKWVRTTMALDERKA